MDAFGEILRKLRLAKGLSREELAEIAGVSPVIVRNYEQGRNDPSWSNVLRLANALEVPLDAFKYDVTIEHTVTIKPKMGRPPKKKENADD